MRKRIFDIIQIGNKSDMPSRLFDYTLVIVILLNISVLFLDTFQELDRWDSLFHVVENSTILFFCLEYVVRIWTADYLYSNKNRLKSIGKFLISV